jgi:GNAT superfamily N-acetyltransferase
MSQPIPWEIRDVRRDDTAALAASIPQKDGTFRHEWLASQQTAGHLDYIAAWSQGLPVGQGIILWEGYVIPELAEEFPCTPVIRSVEVLERHRGRGIGSSIVTELEARARIRGFTFVSLGVMPGNVGAESLWHRLGYVDWGKGIFNATSVYEDAGGQKVSRQERFIPMRKRLP